MISRSRNLSLHSINSKPFLCVMLLAQYMPWLCACLPIRSRILSKWLNNIRQTITRYPKDSSFLLPNVLAKFKWGHPQWTPNEGVVG